MGRIKIVSGTTAGAKKPYFRDWRDQFIDATSDDDFISLCQNQIFEIYSITLMPQGLLCSCDVFTNTVWKSDEESYRNVLEFLTVAIEHPKAPILFWELEPDSCLTCSNPDLSYDTDNMAKWAKSKRNGKEVYSVSLKPQSVKSSGNPFLAWVSDSDSEVLPSSQNPNSKKR